MADKEGWVYVLTNEAMPGLVKTGYTMNDPAIRAEELSGSSVPLPFVVAYKALVVGPKQIEQEVHGKLDSKRLNDKREFFKCEPFEAIRYIRDTTTVKYEESKEDVDRRIQQQKELEEQDRIRRQKELEEQRRIKQQKVLAEQQRAQEIQIKIQIEEQRKKDRITNIFLLGRLDAWKYGSFGEKFGACFFYYFAYPAIIIFFYYLFSNISTKEALLQYMEWLSYPFEYFKK